MLKYVRIISKVSAMEQNHIKHRIKELKNGKNDVYASIADYILLCPDVRKLKIRFIIDHCHVSSSSVVRFCQELGFSGFSEMKYALMKEEDQRRYTHLDRFTMSENADRHLNEIAVSFMQTRDLLSESVLAAVIQSIHDAQQILVFGLGSSYIVALDLEMRFARLKKQIKAMNDINLQYFSARNADPETLVIGICYSGETKDILHHLKVAKEEGSRVLLITNEKNRHFETMFDMVIYIHSSEPTASRISATSRLTMLYIIDLIYLSYLDQTMEESKAILDHNNKL